MAEEPDSTGSPILDFCSKPGDYFRKSILPKLRGPEYHYYHRKIRRVPTVDECKTDDLICVTEANSQYNRDLKIENTILEILRAREAECIFHWMPDQEVKCEKEMRDRKDAESNWQVSSYTPCIYGTCSGALPDRWRRDESWGSLTARTQTLLNTVSPPDPHALAGRPLYPILSHGAFIPYLNLLTPPEPA
jgi:hypothetical protein